MKLIIVPITSGRKVAFSTFKATKRRTVMNLRGLLKLRFGRMSLVLVWNVRY
jgi:hypothetical protein